MSMRAARIIMACTSLIHPVTDAHANHDIVAASSAVGGAFAGARIGANNLAVTLPPIRF